MLIESLETRRLHAVTVTEMYPGFFDVSGDNSHDYIPITVSQAEKSFTLDEVTYTGVAYIYVHGNGGEDHIYVTSIDGTGSIGASVTGDDGNDYIGLNFDGGVWAGAGNDILYLTDAFRGQAYGEAGNDQMHIMGACIDAEIIGDVGNDVIDCSTNLYPVVVRAGEGNDTVYGSAYNDQIYGDGGVDYLHGGGGNDSFYIDGHAGNVDGGDGHDVIYTVYFNGTVTTVEEIYYF
jgi:Ca2+-binding RTX toxin-like protein